MDKEASCTFLNNDCKALFRCKSRALKRSGPDFSQILFLVSFAWNPLLSKIHNLECKLDEEACDTFLNRAFKALFGYKSQALKLSGPKFSKVLIFTQFWSNKPFSKIKIWNFKALFGRKWQALKQFGPDFSKFEIFSQYC